MQKINLALIKAIRRLSKRINYILTDLEGRTVFSIEDIIKEHNDHLIIADEQQSADLHPVLLEQPIRKQQPLLRRFNKSQVNLDYLLAISG